MTACGERPSWNSSSTPSSTARRARRRTSSSGRKISASMPATMRAMVWSLISGKAFLQKAKKVM